MHVSPNPHRTALHNATIEDGPLTARQRRIADAVRLCNSTSDFVAIPREQATTIDVCTIPHHYSADLTDRLVREGLERAQAELDRLKRMYAAYGIEPFVPQQSQVPARPLAGDTRHDIVVNAMRWATRNESILTRAGDSKLSHVNGAYDVEEAA